MVIDLKGKNIVITGGARGLGKGYALACRNAGATVAITDVLEDAGRETLAELNAGGGEHLFFSADVRDPEAMSAVGRELAEKWDRVDGLVNNAALASGLGGKRIENIDPVVWDRVMSVNVKGVWLATRAFLPLIRKSKAGKIVNISSDVALFGSDFILHYVASKGAVVAMTRGMARELGADNIAVNCIAPGMTRVEATAGVPEARHQRYVDGRFLKRHQMPEDITGSVIFLLSDGAGFITGQLLAVNGGYVLN
jgi:NAD(P)-dependent dehydrogenase (short-subunit alcohol dehydrogenase family)